MTVFEEVVGCKSSFVLQGILLRPSKLLWYKRKLTPNSLGVYYQSDYLCLLVIST
jgi:hypothetical protein